MPDYSDEQLNALLQMQDIGEEERKLMQQQALSQQLRGSALQPSAGKDVGSQLARAMQGGLAGYSMVQQDKLGRGAADARTAQLGKVRDILMRKQPQMPQVGPPMQAQPRPPGMGMQQPEDPLMGLY